MAAKLNKEDIITEEMNISYFHDGNNMAIKLILTCWRLKKVVTKPTITCIARESSIDFIYTRTHTKKQCNTNQFSWKKFNFMSCSIKLE